MIEGGTAGRFRLTLSDGNGKPLLGKHADIEIGQNFEKFWILHPDDDVDLAIIPLSSLMKETSESGIQFHYTCISEKIIPSQSLYNSFSSMEEIVMVGYPIGLWDESHNLPLFRRGTTATHPNILLNGKSEFLIDAACFPGSSGSPVFLLNIGTYLEENGVLQQGIRLALLGILYAGPQYTAKGEIVVVNVPTNSTQVSYSEIPCNLGYVIHANKLKDFESILKEKMSQK